MNDVFTKKKLYNLNDTQTHIQNYLIKYAFSHVHKHFIVFSHSLFAFEPVLLFRFDATIRFSSFQTMPKRRISTISEGKSNGIRTKSLTSINFH